MRLLIQVYPAFARYSVSENVSNEKILAIDLGAGDAGDVGQAMH